MPYIFNSADVENFALSLGAETQRKGRGENEELWFRTCPYCHGGDGKDEHTFSVNLNSGAYKCFRGSCNAQGHFVELCRDFNYKLDFGDLIYKSYRAFPNKAIVTTDKAVEYMKSRGISEETTHRYKLTTRNDNDNVLVFPFYDEEGELCNIKYRYINFDKAIHKSKEFSIGCDKNGKPCKQVLFGMQECKNFDTLVITEGQIDSLSLAEAGIENAVSVPTGANGATWLQFCYDWLHKFQKVVVFGDCEKGKITLVDMLQSRVDKLYVVRKQDYLGEKDANDILRKYGKQALIKAVENAEIQPLERIHRLCDVKSVNLDELPKVETGMKELDSIIGGLYFGQLVVITGKTGEGKSTFASQLICEALNQDCNVLAYSGELEDYQFRSWIDFQLAGSHNLVDYKDKLGRTVYKIEEVTTYAISSWYANRMYIYDNTVISDETEDLLKTVEMGIKRYGLNVILIDNLMSAIDINMQQDIYAQQGKFATELKKIAIRYNVLIILIAHPKKTSGNISNDDVSGSSDITKRADVVLSFGRAGKDDDCDCKVNVIKARWQGGCRLNEPIPLMYDSASRRIYPYNGDNRKNYKWEDNGRLQWVLLAHDEGLPF